MTDIESLDDLNKRIESLKVRKMASENENERLIKELENCKKEVKEKYGVEIDGFSNAINLVKDNYIKKMEKLSLLLDEAEKKIGSNT